MLANSTTKIMLPMMDIVNELTLSKVITESFIKDFLAAMAVEAVCSTPGMRPILLSDKRATEVTLEIPQQLKVS